MCTYEGKFMLSEWMTIEDAADYLEISIQQLEELISQKRVQSRTHEYRIKVSGNDVERLLERGCSCSPQSKTLATTRA